MPVNQPKSAPLKRPAPDPTGPEARLYLKEEELDRAVELVLLAQRRFLTAADPVLEARGLGPAHYRALAAIRRGASEGRRGDGEGLTVSALQGVLAVRKQSLARVLGELEAAGLIARAPGAADRRQRRLQLTEAGRAAEREASGALRERLGQVFRQAGAEAVAGARTVLSALAMEDGG